MSDKELLEMAAKAAGIKLLCWQEVARAMRTMPHSGTEPAPYWNPLTSDGDALRLAVKLELRVVPPWHSGGYKRARADHIPTGREGPWVEDQPDQFAATRRAIVRAAAEIGKALP